MSHCSPIFSLPCSPWWRILFFCLGATPSPRCFRACKYAYPPCVLSFSCGYCYVVSSVSVSAATRWAYVRRICMTYNMYLGTYVRWFHLLIFVWGTVYDLFQLLCIIFCLMCIIFCLICFPPEVDLSLHGGIGYWSLSCNHGPDCSDCCCSHMDSSLQCIPWSQDRLQ